MAGILIAFNASPMTAVPLFSALRVLVADDDRTTTAILAATLERWGASVAIAHDGTAAWEMLCGGYTPSIAVVDWSMPGMDGPELCRRVRQEPRLAGLYMILLTGRDTRTDLVAGLDAGADDYMVKPVDAEELRARVQVGMRVAALQARLAERVIELQSARDHLTRLVSTDMLTELHSRRCWFDLAWREFERSRRYARVFSLLTIDLDYFKTVNDTFGHDQGDKMLQRFADMMRSECRTCDVIGRLGGEEFAVLVPETAIDSAQVVAQRIVEACRRLRVSTQAGDAACSCSIGVSQLHPEDENVESVLRRADAAMYEAKRSGRNCWKSGESIDSMIPPLVGR
jgi:two-component system, cell cycle response regulator